LEKTSILSVKVDINKQVAIIHAVPEEYVQGLLAEIESAKAKGLTTVYRISDKMSKNVASYTKRFFFDKPQYNLDMTSCARCTNKWDVIITWSKIDG